MAQQVSQSSNQQSAHKSDRVTKHIISFAVMIVLTAAAFYLVAAEVVPEHLILPFLLVLGAIQVFLQLFTFMHLDQKGTVFYRIFIAAGLFFATLCVVGIFFM